MLKGISNESGYTAFLDIERRTGGKFDFRRSYSPGLVTSYTTYSEVAKDLDQRVSVYSMKPATPWGSGLNATVNGVRNWALGVPKNAKIRFCIQHEPEDNAKETLTSDLSGTAAEFCTMQREVAKVLDEVNVDRPDGYKIRFHGNLMTWSADSRAGTFNGGLKADLFWPGDGVWSAIAWDGYQWPYFTKVYSGEEIFHRCVDYCNAKGVGFAVNECGIDPKFAGYPWNASIPKWIDSTQAYCESVDARWFSYYNSRNWVLSTDAQFKALV